MSSETSGISSLPLGIDPDAQAYMSVDEDAESRLTKRERGALHIGRAIGKEPKLTEETTNEQMLAAFNWYSYNYVGSDSKKFVLNYLKKAFKGGDQVAAKFADLEDWRFGATGWMAKQLHDGHKLPASYMERFQERLKALNLLLKARAPVVAATIKEAAPAVAKLFTTGAKSIISEIDERIDTFTKKEFLEFNAYNWLAERSPSSNTISDVIDYYQPYLDEVLAAEAKSGDDQVREAYEKIPKARIRSLRDFLAKFISASDQLSHTKKRERKPRAKKVKSALQLTKGLKYKQSDDTYKIRSIQPTELVGALQLWVFNTKTRKLGVYHAVDDKPLSIKGTTIQDYNETTSFQKKVRKPEKVLPDVLSGNKVALRKIMDGVNAKSSKLNGRINSDTILLRSAK